VLSGPAGFHGLFRAAPFKTVVGARRRYLSYLDEVSLFHQAERFSLLGRAGVHKRHTPLTLRHDIDIERLAAVLKGKSLADSHRRSVLLRLLEKCQTVFCLRCTRVSSRAAPFQHRVLGGGGGGGVCVGVGVKSGLKTFSL
jgi:hypothetical protein